MDSLSGFPEDFVDFLGILITIIFKELLLGIWNFISNIPPELVIFLYTVAIITIIIVQIKKKIVSWIVARSMARKLEQEHRKAFLEESSPVSIESGGSCRICGYGLGDFPQVICRECSTPHHRDCWQYNGHCATYSCGSFAHNPTEEEDEK